MKRKGPQVIICIVFAIVLWCGADYATRDFLNEELAEVRTENPQIPVSCVFDGDTDLDRITEVHLGYEIHYLYLGSGNKVYEIKGTMQLLEWKQFLEDLLYKNDLKIGENEVPKRIRGYDVALSEGELNTIYYYDFFKYYTRNIMDFEQFDRG